MLAASVSSWAQPASTDKALATVTVTEKAEGKDALRATSTSIGKGSSLRDIPQSITVVTEKLMDDRNLDNLKDVLRNTRGRDLPGG